jgi:hypothetical protein
MVPPCLLSLLFSFLCVEIIVFCEAYNRDVTYLKRYALAGFPFWFVVNFWRHRECQVGNSEAAVPMNKAQPHSILN